MGLDKDTLHVVIRLPFRRPPGFVEPPSIVWTEEMEHKLWQYMSQKKTDWNFIAEQLGVPTSYVVRHAAFVYETQLRGIHQQLRINVNNSTMSRNSAKSPTPSKPRPTSIRYSNTLQYQQQVQQQQQLESPEPSSQQRISNESIQRSGSLSRLSRENLRSTKSSSTTTSQYKSSPSSTTNSRIQTVTAYVHDSSEDSDIAQEEDTDEKSKEKEETNDEEEFSNQFERMRLQVEEPAFLPQKTGDISSSLSNSRQQLSMSIQNLRKLNTLHDSSASSSSVNSNSTTPPNTQTHTPVATTSYHPSTAPGSSNESAMNSIGSSFSDLSDSSVTQSALEEAFLSKFNQGSKMSLMNSLRRYRE